MRQKFVTKRIRVGLFEDSEALKICLSLTIKIIQIMRNEGLKFWKAFAKVWGFHIWSECWWILALEPRSAI